MTVPRIAQTATVASRRVGLQIRDSIAGTPTVVAMPATAGIPSRAQELTVVLPAFNPGLRLEQTLGKLSSCAAGWNGKLNIVVVDDGSDQLCVADGDVVGTHVVSVLTHERNRGKGAALRTGFEYTLECHSPDVVAFVDADGDIDPEFVITYSNTLAESLSAGDRTAAVIGSKLEPGSERHVPGWRRAASSVFSTLVGWLVPVGVSDTQVGAKAFSAEVMACIINDLEQDGFLFDVEVLARIHAAGLPVIESPVVLRIDQPGTVKLTTAVVMAWQLVKISSRLRSRTAARQAATLAQVSTASVSSPACSAVT